MEYSPFYTRGITGMSSSELVVTQGFDFPTLYGARRKSGKVKQEALDRRYQAVRRDILLQAKNIRRCAATSFCKPRISAST